MKFFPGISESGARPLGAQRVNYTWLSQPTHAAKLNHSSEEIATYISGIALWELYYMIMTKLYIHYLKLFQSFTLGLYYDFSVFLSFFLHHS